MCWSSDIELIGENIRKISINRNSRKMSYADVINGWKNDSDFIHYFCSILKASPFEAYFWETPAINNNNLNRGFEFVEVQSHALNRMLVDPKSFEQHFDDAITTVTAFVNLGGDALLIAPCPENEQSSYPHLAAFLRDASSHEIESFWKEAGVQIKKNISDNYLWVSTAGSGVAWLHLRLDSFPKYYSYHPYSIRP